MLSSVELAALAGTRFADVRWVAETDSTNQRLLELAGHGADEGIVLVADHQTAGRGRLGRSWEAPPGSSLLVSVLLRPPVAVDDAHLVTMAAGVAAAEACAEVAGFEPGLKWPNDLVVDVDGETRKLAGLLAESVVTGRRLDAVVVGMGLNVQWPPELPGELAAIATAANHVAGRDVDRAALLVAWLQALDRWYGAVCGGSGGAGSGGGGSGGGGGLVDAYVARSATIGRRVRVELPGGSFEGVAAGIGGHGHLVVETDGGERREVAAGDVVHLRPAG